MTDFVRLKFTGAVPGGDSADYILYSTVTAFGGKCGHQMAGMAKLVINLFHTQAGTLKLYASQDRGLNWTQVRSSSVSAPAAGLSTAYETLVEAFQDFKVVWTNGGVAQATWYPDMALSDDRTVASAAAAAAVTPTTLGVTYQLEASDAITGAVSSWAPRIGTGTLTQGTGALQPTQVAAAAAFGNKPVVRFSATTHKMAVAATYVVPLATPNGYTVMAVAQSTGGSTYMWGQLSGTSARYGRYGSNLLRHEEGASTITSSAIVITNACSVFWQCDASRNIRFGLNGVQVGADQVMPSFTAAGAAGQFIFGDVGGPGFIGDVAEFLVWPSAASSAVLLSAHADYIAPKYGL